MTSTRSTIAFCDLDRTLIYSESALRLNVSDENAPRLLCVEVRKGRPLSFLTEAAGRLVADLARAGVLVPVTTRTVEQYRRVRLPGPGSKFVLCANGGRLLRGGVEDLDFTAAVSDRLEVQAGPHAEILEFLQRVSRPTGGPPFVHEVRDASGLFCYAVVNRAQVPAEWVEEVAAFASDRSWDVSVQGRKVYCVPAPLSKASAAREIANMLGAERVLAAGDSLLDADLLDVADLGIRPRHGELADSEWFRPHVAITETEGVTAGEEIAAWMARESGVALSDARVGAETCSILAQGTLGRLASDEAR